MYPSRAKHGWKVLGGVRSVCCQVGAFWPVSPSEFKV